MIDLGHELLEKHINIVYLVACHTTVTLTMNFQSPQHNPYISTKIPYIKVNDRDLPPAYINQTSGWRFGVPYSPSHERSFAPSAVIQ